MAGMQRDLGVQCGFCHEEDPDTKRINYVSDENPRKETARSMMRMTNGHQYKVSRVNSATGSMHRPSPAAIVILARCIHHPLILLLRGNLQ